MTNESEVPHRTGRIEGVKYGIGTDTTTTGNRHALTVSMEHDYKLTELKMRITAGNKVVVETTDGKPENWDRVYFLDGEHLDSAKALIQEGYSIMERTQDSSTDIYDLEYQLMLLVGGMFKNWSNIHLPESTEEILQMHEIAAGEQEKMEREVEENGG